MIHVNALKRFGIDAPKDCILENGVVDIHHERIAITLKQDFSESRILEKYKDNVRIIAIVCDEYVVSKGSDFVCVDFVHDSSGGGGEIRRGELYRDKAYVDVIPPGPRQLAYRVWVSPNVAPIDEDLADIIPELKKCRDLHRGASITTSPTITR
jgi:hypothetical protein